MRSSSWSNSTSGFVIRDPGLISRQNANNTNATAPAAVNNATAPFYLFGDLDTINAVMDELVAKCSVVDAIASQVDVSVYIP